MAYGIFRLYPAQDLVITQTSPFFAGPCLLISLRLVRFVFFVVVVLGGGGRNAMDGMGWDGTDEQEYVRNSRGVQLFTCGWLPVATSPKALVFLCHGN